ncbi:MAG: hypothetical protein AAFU53_03070 [Cyanobacteria bacterium J06632_3]
MPTKLLQIVPRLPPYTDGVGDYSRLLAQQLSTAHQINTEFIVFCPSPDMDETVDGFRAQGLRAHGAEAFLSLISEDIDAVLLHYSNFPYVRGKLEAPFWLADAIETLCSQRSLPLVVMFHELPTLKWKSIRLLNPIQSRVSKKLARIASAVFTDSHHFKSHLERWTQSSITCIPDFSTIGEPAAEDVQPLSARKSRLIIFGGADRKRVFRQIDRIVETCQALDISEICDIGTPQSLDPDSFHPIIFHEMGFQPAERVRQLLLDSTAGLMDYSRFPGDLGKSSVFAAFCAHGLMPICTEYNPSEPDGVFADQQYAIAGPHLSHYSPQQRQNIATQARNWYSQHSLDINAKLFASHLH